jgi:hypothetical protein
MNAFTRHAMNRLALLAPVLLYACAAAAQPAPPAPAPTASPRAATAPPAPLRGVHADPDGVREQVEAAREQAEAARDQAEAARDQAQAWRRWARDFQDDLHASLGAMFVSRVGSTSIVKGAPYSAEVITERNQPLPDGNRITHSTHGRVYRDGSGRVRQETEGRDGKPGTVFIDDTVAGMRYMILPGRKHAVAFPDPRTQPTGTHRSETFSEDGTTVQVEDGKVLVNGKPAAPGEVNVKTPSGKQVRIEHGHIYVDGQRANRGAKGHNVTVVSRDDGGLTREMVRIEAIRSGDDTTPAIAEPPLPPVPPLPPLPPLPPAAPGEVEAPIAPLPPLPGVNTLRFESTARLGRGVTRSLGSKEFDGVRADGRSTVWTIPAGQVGNVKPIAITSESWYSPELQVTVYSRYDDPRAGESIYRLKDIRRGEPPARLFKADAK